MRGLKYPVICQLAGWPEAFLVTSATIGSVIKVFLEQIILNRGLWRQWTRMRELILQGDPSKDYDCFENSVGPPYPQHSENSGQVERMNEEIDTPFCQEN